MTVLGQLMKFGYDCGLDNDTDVELDVCDCGCCTVSLSINALILMK